MYPRTVRKSGYPPVHRVLTTLNIIIIFRFLSPRRRFRGALVQTVCDAKADTQPVKIVHGSITHFISNEAKSGQMVYMELKTIWPFFLFFPFFCSGRRFDMKGDERNWWSQETLEAFERKTACLEEQYSNFTFDGGTVRPYLEFKHKAKDRTVICDVIS